MIDRRKPDYPYLAGNLTGYSEAEEIKRVQTTVNECLFKKNRKKLEKNMRPDDSYDGPSWGKIDAFYDFVNRAFQNRSGSRR